MVLLGHYDPAGNTPRSQGIAISQKSGDTWSRPRNVSIPYFQNKSSFVSGYISPDLNTLVYSAEAYGSYGVEDIFVCQRADGKWSAPKNIGSKINSTFQELCPSLSPDGRTLYFSTNGRKGKGSFDIYSASRLDDSWTNWSEPENISTVNSDGRDLFYRDYSASGFALYTSTKNSDGYGDVKMYGPRDPLPPADTTRVVADATPGPVEIAEKPQSSGSHVVTIHGKVVNAKTGESIPASISFESQSAVTTGPGKVQSEVTGYSAALPSSNQYVVNVEARGFISIREKLDIQTYEMNDLEMNFRLQPIEVGTTVELKDVLFEQSKTILLPQSFPELDLVVSFMKTNPDVRIELAGHTDNRGIPAQNVKLSQGRVDRVKEYLISKGIPAKRISGKGYGGNKPVASNESEETRKLNRRVEFTIRKN
jgi:outer membrane protein OmpA-like peptidoglycan-associated protein